MDFFLKIQVYCLYRQDKIWYTYYGDGMKNILLNDLKYDLIKNIRDGFDYDEVKSKTTDYFINFDYIVGDWAYGKLRLKGFYDKGNKNCKDFNNIDNLDKYLKENCAFNCKYFVLKKSIQK